MEHFVTLFNSLYLPQGLALHTSMERHVLDYVLWILCVDDETHEVLATLALPHVRLIKLSEVETDSLQAIKPTRTIGEYCWTLTPFAPRFVFEADASVARVTYIDADLWFLKHPGPVFAELNSAGKGVLITDHAYAPEHDQSGTSGQFCVQFVTFTRCEGEEVRNWWEERCLEWCYARAEDGKFGDQKYLDDWPNRFAPAVHVLQDKERALAPWNATRFPFGNAVFYHFHGLRIISEVEILLGNYAIPNHVINNIYKPYLIDLRKALETLNSVHFKWNQQARRPRLRQRVADLFRRARRAWRSVLPPKTLKW
jgi:hypothetical protein